MTKNNQNGSVWSRLVVLILIGVVALVCYAFRKEIGAFFQDPITNIEQIFGVAGDGYHDVTDMPSPLPDEDFGNNMTGPGYSEEV